VAIEHRTKTVHYARATFVVPPKSGANLQSLVNAIMKTHLPTVPERTLVFPDGRVIQPRHQRPRTQNGGTLLHLVTYVEDEHATTVPHATSADVEKDLGSALPPANEEYMDGEAFILISGMHVIICSSDLSDLKLCRYFDELIVKAGLSDLPCGLSFARVADLDVVKMIAQFGVRSVTLNASLYEATRQRIQRTDGLRSKVSAFLGGVKSLVSMDTTEADADKNADLLAKITISIPGHNKSTIAQAGLDELARNVIEDDDADDVLLKFGNGATRTVSRVCLRKLYRIQSLHKGLNYGDAFSKIDAYFSELKTERLLDN
jgi:hypothetical protein